MFTVERCPACGGPLRPTFDVDVGGERMSVHVCAHCASYTKSPFYEPADLARIYENYDLHERHYAPTAGELDNIAARVRRIERFAPRRGRLLEIGCGRGYFLREALRRGWDARGIEFEGSARRHLLPDVEGRVEFIDSESAFRSVAPASVDILCSYQVFEHVTRPAATFAAWADAVRPGGALVVNTPNAGSLGARIHKAGWSQHRKRDHFILFSVRALDRLYRTNGLRVIGRFFGGPPAVLSGSVIKAPGPTRLYRSPGLTRLGRWIVYAFGMGDNVEIVGRKGGQSVSTTT